MKIGCCSTPTQFCRYNCELFLYNLQVNHFIHLKAMAVNGVPRQRVHEGRWDMVMGLTAKSLMRSLQMACRRRHNYILDQTNVSRESRKKKLAQFQVYKKYEFYM
jgi:heterogeneous nuclear ribonucleoprotein U-like protein 1